MAGFQYGTEPKYTINQVSKMLSISKPTIRYYEEIGLSLKASRDKNNIRMFSDNDVMRLRTIQCMRSSGMGLEHVRHYIELSTMEAEGILERYSIILQQENILLQKKKELEEQLAFIEHKKQVYKDQMEGGRGTGGSGNIALRRFRI